MRYIFVFFGWLLIGALPAIGQTPQPPSSPDDIIKRARESFRTAKNKEQVESVKMWCKDSLKSLTFHEIDRLMVQSIKLLEAGKVEEANAITKRVSALDELNDNLARMVCRPD